MKKGFYIHSGTKTVFSGINNKISDQMNVFSSCYDVSEVIIEKEKTNVIKSCLWRLPLGSWGRDYGKAISDILAKANGDTVAFFYIRYNAIDLRYIVFLRKLRSFFPNAVLMMEIATFPYDKELLQSKTMFPWLFKDRFYRIWLKKYIDRIATYSADDEIYGIPTINIINGIDVNRINPIKKDKTDEQDIRLIAVAQFQPSHGYERLIVGLNDYYSCGGKRNIELHMIGGGTEEKKYMALVKEFGLEDRIRFYGVKTGKELDECYENSDIGIAGLGLYKRGIKRSSALKVREYLAKGLPVVCGAPNDAFSSGGKQFCMEYPNESSAIDIKKMVDWYDNLIEKSGDRLELAKAIRMFAYNNVDIRITMKPVIDYLRAEADG